MDTKTFNEKYRPVRNKTGLEHFARIMTKKSRNLNEPRLAGHKLNKKQFLSNAGYKERSVKSTKLGFTQDYAMTRIFRLNTPRKESVTKTYHRFGKI